MTIEDQDTTPTFLGGLHLGYVFLNWPWPAARLTCLPDAVVIGPSSPILRVLFLPTIVFHYEEISELIPVGEWMGFRGIRFNSSIDGRWAIFWSHSRNEVLRVLEERSGKDRGIPERYRLLVRRKS